MPHWNLIMLKIPHDGQDTGHFQLTETLWMCLSVSLTQLRRLSDRAIMSLVSRSDGYKLPLCCTNTGMETLAPACLQIHILQAKCNM